MDHSPLKRVVLIALCVALLITVHVAASLSKGIYMWTDEIGTLHITDDPESVPPDADVTVETIDDVTISETEVETYVEPEWDPKYDEEAQAQRERERDEEKRYWRSLMADIENREYALKYEIEYTEGYLSALKRDVDWYLINGYRADAMIFDLRNGEIRLKELRKELPGFVIEKQALEERARIARIPPGYLRE